MDLGRPVGRNGVVAAGSVWESRMKLDECKGGIKVFNGEEPTEEKTENSNTNTNTSSNGLQVYKRMRPKQSIVGVSGKRKTWKSETCQGIDKSPIQIVKQRSELDQQCKELTQSADGIRKSPIGIRKTRSEVSKELSGIEKSPIHSMKTRSRSQMTRGKMEMMNRISDESGDVNGDLNKVKSEGDKASDDSVENVNGLINGTESDLVEISKESFDKNSGEIDKAKDALQGESVKGEKGIEKNSIGSDCEEYVVCEEKMVTSNLGLKLNVGDEDDWEEEFEKIQVKEVSVEEENPKKVVVMDENKIQERVENPQPISEIKPKKIVFEDRKILQRNEKTIPNSPIVRKLQPPVVNNPRIIPKQTKTHSIPVSDRYQRVPRTHNKLQSLVDLVMWRDSSKSAFVFGAGTFIIISSSYTTDLNISFISVVSYLSLVYLAAIFLLRTIICRGTINVDDTSHVVGEEEAIWLLKLILPYINEFLLKLKALFSGDPATTMKMAVLLFVLARCGSYITIWKMAKLGFFGVFTVPKICSSYSAQLTVCGTFWIHRFRDAWESCAHKKAVAFAVFALVWNLSSVVARIWAVFMLFVAFRYYQHSLLREDNWVEDEEVEEEEEETTVGNENTSGKGPISRPRQRGGPSSVSSRKQKKLS